MSGTVEKALNLLELLSTYDGPVRLADLARANGMNKSTAFRMLETMSHLGYVTQDEPNGRYMMTTRMWEIGLRALQQNDLRALARPHLQDLMTRTGETAVLTRRDRWDVVLVEKIDCNQDLQAMATLGSRSPVHASSFGKAFLMAEPRDVLTGLTLQQFTPATITSLDALSADIDRACTQGAATGRDEYRVGVSGVAAPVMGPDGLAYGSVGISLPTLRFTDEARAHFVTAVTEVARAISTQMGWRGQA